MSRPFLLPITGTWVTGTVDQIIDIVHTDSSRMTTHIHSMPRKEKCACLILTAMQGQREDLRAVEKSGEAVEAAQAPGNGHDVMV